MVGLHVKRAMRTLDDKAFLMGLVFGCDRFSKEDRPFVSALSFWLHGQHAWMVRLSEAGQFQLRSAAPVESHVGHLRASGSKPMVSFLGWCTTHFSLF